MKPDLTVVKHSWRYFPVTILGALFFGATVFTSTGCEKEVEVLVHDTLMVKVAVLPSPDSVAVGGSVTLTATVTTELQVGTVQYFWHATDGTLDESEGDTVAWKAPDEEGAYTVSVHATDGVYIGIGTVAIGVGMYAPTVTPYYVGHSECSTCHGESDVSGAGYSIHDAWSETDHAGAWQTLQESGHAASYCFPCHTVGYAAGTGTGDSGYDEAPIGKFENVQCENCHGPGSDHVSSLNEADITHSWDAATVCGQCHTGSHNPFLEEWESSPHNSVGFQAASSSCQGCHEGVAASIRLSGDLSTFYGSGTIADRPDTSDQPLTPISCAVCHSPHQADNPHQIRTVDDVHLVEANSESPVVSEGGTGKICMQCHHARRSADTQLDEGYAHFGPHGNPQADMLSAKSAYHGVADASFPWAAPSHLYIENSCRTCHMYMKEYESEDNPAIKGHTFQPTVEACAKCHGTISDFEEIMARDDFDGDGTVEGLHDEVEGLLHLLEEALVADGLDTTGTDVEHALGDTSLSTYKQRQAGYNWVFVEADKSHGIHNPDYAIQLLQQSYKHLTGSLPRNAVPHYGDRKVVMNW